MSKTTKIEEILGVKFKNPQLLTQALTHRSYLNEEPGTNESNERLEFLGDSVLSILVSTELFKRFPSFPEGKLTNLRSMLVRAQTLSKIAGLLGLGEFLLMSRGEQSCGGRQNGSILADTFEAVLGAIYLDHGLETAKTFLVKNLFPLIEELASDKTFYDFKSRLQEIIQEKDKVAPTYKVLKEAGPDHNKTFTVAVFTDQKEIGVGTGKSKQEAQQEAARIALESLEVV